MMMMVALSTFLSLFLHQILQMRELAQISPEGDSLVHTPEGVELSPAANIGTRTCWHACQYPPATWLYGTDRKVDRVDLSEFKQQKAVHGRYLPMLRQCQRKRRD
jgi:hypothetical protein